LTGELTCRKSASYQVESPFFLPTCGRTAAPAASGTISVCQAADIAQRCTTGKRHIRRRCPAIFPVLASAVRGVPSLPRQSRRRASMRMVSIGWYNHKARGSTRMGTVETAEYRQTGVWAEPGQAAIVIAAVAPKLRNWRR
jgi:hypothetical protein